MSPITTDTRDAFWSRAIEDYREIEALPQISRDLHEHARNQRLRLEAEAPLLEWEATP